MFGAFVAWFYMEVPGFSPSRLRRCTHCRADLAMIIRRALKEMGR